MNKYWIYPAILSTLCTALYQTAWSDTTAAPAVAPAVAPVPNIPTPPTNTISTTTTSTTTTVAPTVPAPLNCQYHIPAATTNIDNKLVSDWGVQAIVQSFDFSPQTLPTQLAMLQNCFTDQGWKGFNDALQKSGNIAAIKTQNLTVSSQPNGQPTVTMMKDNQWKLNLPLQVVYQNDKQKLTQILTVDVLIGRKMNGDLGIMQMIATPKPAATAPVTPITNPTP